jgi:hypothetical protein
MQPQIVYRKKQAKKFYGDPPDTTWWEPDTTWWEWQQTGKAPKPDVMLGERTPGWTDGHIARHQRNLIIADEGK